jgi:hypothetical protein
VTNDEETMKSTKQIELYLSRMPVGEPFTANAFRHLATADNTRQVLSRFVKSGKIKRVSRGVFVKPKAAKKLTVALPSTTEIAKALTKSTGETITVQGAEAARLLQLSTQVPMQLVFYTNGNSRKLKIGNRQVTLKHVNPSKLVKPGTPIGLAISALSYLGKEQVTLESIAKIQSQLTEKDFTALLHEVNSMPSWMADLFFKYRNEKGINNG